MPREQQRVARRLSSLFSLPCGALFSLALLFFRRLQFFLQRSQFVRFALRRKVRLFSQRAKVRFFRDSEILFFSGSGLPLFLPQRSILPAFAPLTALFHSLQRL